MPCTHIAITCVPPSRTRPGERSERQTRQGNEKGMAGTTRNPDHDARDVSKQHLTQHPLGIPTAHVPCCLDGTLASTVLLDLFTSPSSVPDARGSPRLAARPPICTQTNTRKHWQPHGRAGRECVKTRPGRAPSRDADLGPSASASI